MEFRYAKYRVLQQNIFIVEITENLTNYIETIIEILNDIDSTRKIVLIRITENNITCIKINDSEEYKTLCTAAMTAYNKTYSRLNWIIESF